MARLAKGIKKAIRRRELYPTQTFKAGRDIRTLQ